MHAVCAITTEDKPSHCHSYGLQRTLSWMNSTIFSPLRATTGLR